MQIEAILFIKYTILYCVKNPKLLAGSDPDLK